MKYLTPSVIFLVQDSYSIQNSLIQEVGLWPKFTNMLRFHIKIREVESGWEGGGVTQNFRKW